MSEIAQNQAQVEAIAQADAHLSNAALLSYSELIGALQAARKALLATLTLNHRQSQAESWHALHQTILPHEREAVLACAQSMQEQHPHFAKSGPINSYEEAVDRLGLQILREAAAICPSLSAFAPNEAESTRQRQR